MLLLFRCDPLPRGLDITQQNEDDGLDSYPSLEWDGTQACADGRGAVTEYDPTHAIQNSTEEAGEEAGAFTSDEGWRR